MGFSPWGLEQVFSSSFPPPFLLSVPFPSPFSSPLWSLSRSTDDRLRETAWGDEDRKGDGRKGEKRSREKGRDPSQDSLPPHPPPLSSSSSSAMDLEFLRLHLQQWIDYIDTYDGRVSPCMIHSHLFECLLPPLTHTPFPASSALGHDDQGLGRHPHLYRLPVHPLRLQGSAVHQETSPSPGILR